MTTRRSQADWSEGLEPSRPAQAGLSLLERAKAINPGLQSLGSTAELLRGINGQPAAPAPAASEATAHPPEADLVRAVAEARKRHGDELRRIDAAIAALQCERSALPGRIRDGIERVITLLDPNLVSPQTRAMLRAEAAFLEAVGFSVKRYVDKKRQSPSLPRR